MSVMHDVHMSLDNLHERQVISIAKTEQAMGWLVAHGPLVVEPPLPAWITDRLVTAQRVMRLRRGVFLVPGDDGRLPSLPRAMDLLDPAGYVTGHGALAAQGLNDQDVSHWWAAAGRRQADISYGLYRAHFVFSPESARVGQRHVVPYEGDRVRMATPTQALVDEARLIPFGFDWVETGRVLRNAVETGRTAETGVLELLSAQPSMAATRRLGLLFELVRGSPDPRLLAAARRNLTVSRIVGDEGIDETWRITLPHDRARIARGMK
jgi:hypothetical protein